MQISLLVWFWLDPISGGFRSVSALPMFSCRSKLSLMLYLPCFIMFNICVCQLCFKWYVCFHTHICFYTHVCFHTYVCFHTHVCQMCLGEMYCRFRSHVWSPCSTKLILANTGVTMSRKKGKISCMRLKWCLFHVLLAKTDQEQWDAGCHIGSIQMDCYGVPGDLYAHKENRAVMVLFFLRNIGHSSAVIQNPIHLICSHFEPVDYKTEIHRFHFMTVVNTSGDVSYVFCILCIVCFLYSCNALLVCCSYLLEDQVLSSLEFHVCLLLLFIADLLFVFAPLFNS